MVLCLKEEIVLDTRSYVYFHPMWIPSPSFSLLAPLLPLKCPHKIHVAIWHGFNLLVQLCFSDCIIVKLYAALLSNNSGGILFYNKQ